MRGALAATALAAAAWTALVRAGTTTGLDDWAISHVMPGLDPRHPGRDDAVALVGLWRPFPLGASWWMKLLDAYQYPASVLLSACLVALAGAALLRRGRRRAALAWAGAWVVANAVELAGKHGLARPPLHWTNGVERVRVEAFDHAYPSGHAARAVLVAALVATVWPRLRRPAAAWTALVPVSLVVSAAHAVSDAVGGLLLGMLLLVVVRSVPEDPRTSPERGS